MSTIQNGRNGNKATVDKKGRLHGYNVVIDEALQANQDGDAYSIETGLVTLTDAVNTPVLFIKNNEIKSLHIRIFAFGSGTSTGGSATVPIIITIIRNPTTGTIVSDANNVAINSNRNFGSTKTLNIDAFVGATGSTLTDGSDHIKRQIPAFDQRSGSIDELIPRGASIAFKVQAPPSNTSVDINVGVIAHLEIDTSDV